MHVEKSFYLKSVTVYDLVCTISKVRLKAWKLQQLWKLLCIQFVVVIVKYRVSGNFRVGLHIIFAVFTTSLKIAKNRHREK